MLKGLPGVRLVSCMKKIKFTTEQQTRLSRLETLMSALVFISLPLCFISGHDIENYPEWLSFLLILITAGIVAAAIISGLLHHFFPETKTYKNAKGFKLHYHIYFCSILISIGLGFFINEQWTRSQECKTCLIVKKDKTYFYRNQYIFIKKKHAIERISFGRAFYKKHYRDNYLSLYLVTGCLGFTYYKYPCP